MSYNDWLRRRGDECRNTKQYNPVGQIVSSDKSENMPIGVRFFIKNLFQNIWNEITEVKNTDILEYTIFQITFEYFFGFFFFVVLLAFL